MAEHTSTPWRLRTSGNVGNAVEAFCGKTHGDLDDGFRIVATYQECISGVDYKTHVANARANGEFIVRAVNSHDALVKALRVALNFIENTESELGIQLSSGETAREALALASHIRAPESDAQPLETREVQS